MSGRHYHGRRHDAGEVQALCASLGITYRQLDHWARRGLLQPQRESPGSGKFRDWTESEQRIAAAMGRLVRLGLTPVLASQVARAGRESDVRFAITQGSGSDADASADQPATPALPGAPPTVA